MSIASRTTLLVVGVLSLLTPLSQAGEPVPVLGCLLEPTTVAELSASTRGKVADIQVRCWRVWSPAWRSSMLNWPKSALE